MWLVVLVSAKIEPFYGLMPQVAYSMTLFYAEPFELKCAVDIIKAYEKRWNIESFFYEYKHMLGLKDMMQHSLKTYYKWAYIRLISYNIINFLKISHETEIKSFISFSTPWRTTNKKVKLSISLRMAQAYFFALFSSFDKTKILHETIKNSNEFLKKNKQPLNNRGYKSHEFVDYLLKTG